MRHDDGGADFIEKGDAGVAVVFGDFGGVRLALDLAGVEGVEGAIADEAGTGPLLQRSILI